MKNNCDLNTSTTITINSSSRKGKNKSSASSSNNKPKQPQRSVGIAQLEKIRLLSQLNSGILPHHQVPHLTTLLNSPFQMGVEDYIKERPSNMRYLESQFQNTARWNPYNNVNVIPENHAYAQQPAIVAQQQRVSHVEKHPDGNKFFKLKGENNKKPEPTRNDELDLELQL